MGGEEKKKEGREGSGGCEFTGMVLYLSLNIPVAKGQLPAMSNNSKVITLLGIRFSILEDVMSVDKLPMGEKIELYFPLTPMHQGHIINILSGTAVDSLGRDTHGSIVLYILWLVLVWSELQCMAFIIVIVTHIVTNNKHLYTFFS